MADTQWIVSTVAGTGVQGYAGDGGPATQALLNNPFDLAFDPGGNLCFSDTYNHCIRRIDAGPASSQRLLAQVKVASRATAVRQHRRG